MTRPDFEQPAPQGRPGPIRNLDRHVDLGSLGQGDLCHALRPSDWIPCRTRPRSEVLRASLEDYFFVRRFRELRQRMMAAAQAQGIFTDEDVFDRVT